MNDESKEKKKHLGHVKGFCSQNLPLVICWLPADPWETKPKGFFSKHLI